jgi:predicted nucleic acid-binding protein
MRVIDTNVLVYHLLGASGELSTRSSALFRRLKADDASAYLPITAIFECVYACQSAYSVPGNILADVLLEIVGFPGIVVDRKDALHDALVLWQTQGQLSFVDCYHLALTKALGLTEINTFDTKMDRYPGVSRIEP